MRQFFAIASNAFMELIRQPIFLLLLTTSSLFEVGLACVNYFGFGDEPKLVKNSALAVMLLTGLFSAVMSASASVAREIRSGTALAVLAKPVSRASFCWPSTSVWPCRWWCSCMSIAWRFCWPPACF